MDAILPKKKINYLSNKELLKEIANSKLSYCEIKKEKYHYYDGILPSVGSITPDIVAKAKITRAIYMNEKNIEELMLKGLSSKDAVEFNNKHKIKPSQLTKADLCFRVMTMEHVPAYIMEKPKSILPTLFFYPFKHYTFVQGKWREVVRSHWTGNFKTGKFDIQRGKLNNKLVRSLMMLVDRYAQKGNFRNYTYLEDMKGNALLQLSRVALHFDETKSDNPFAFYTTCIKHSFVKILKEEKKIRNMRDDLISMEGFQGSYSYQLDNTNEFDSPAIEKMLGETPVVEKKDK